MNIINNTQIIHITPDRILFITSPKIRAISNETFKIQQQFYYVSIEKLWGRLIDHIVFVYIFFIILWSCALLFL